MTVDGGGRWKSVIDYLSLVGTRYFGMLVGAFRALVIPGLLDPAGYGTYKTLLLIPGYVRAGHLGAVSGLSRQIPYYRGSGEGDRLDLAVRVAYTFSIGSALLACLLIGSYAFIFAEPGLRLLLLVFLVFVVTEQQIAFRETYLLGFERFQSAARLRLTQNLVAAGLAVAGAWLGGVAGLVAGTALAGMISLTLFRMVSGVGFPGLSVDRAMTRELLVIGAPLLVTGLLYNVFFTIDRIIIVNMLGAVAMGHYALAVTIVGYINDLTTLFSKIVFPKMVTKLGAGESPQQVARYVHLPMAGASYVFPFGMIAVHYLAVWLFRGVFPKYEPGAGVLEILTFATLLYTHFLVYMNLVVAMKRQLQMMWMYPLATLVGGGVALMAVHLDWGIEGVAFGTTAGFLVLSLCQCVFCESRLLGSEHVFFRIVRSYGPTLYLAALVATDHVLFGDLGGSLAHDLLRGGVVLAAYLPVIVLAWRMDVEFRGVLAMARRGRNAI
jgi:O-antigen/teichoic acid export membrane protein